MIYMLPTAATGIIFSLDSSAHLQPVTYWQWTCSSILLVFLWKKDQLSQFI